MSQVLQKSVIFVFQLHFPVLQTRPKRACDFGLLSEVGATLALTSGPYSCQIRKAGNSQACLTASIRVRHKSCRTPQSRRGLFSYKRTSDTLQTTGPTGKCITSNSGFSTGIVPCIV